MESGGMREGPGSGGSITDREEFTYRPISLQYRPYTANSKAVRRESLGGDLIEVTENGQVQRIKENRSYFGETGIIKNERHLDLVLNTAAAAKPVIVALDMSNDFAFGLNWSGVITDDRTAKYQVPPVVGKPPQ